MRAAFGHHAIVLAFAMAVIATLSNSATAGSEQVARGRYLVTVMGCGDCHTPGYFFGKPNMTRYLGGSDVGFVIPGLGVFVPPNLTPDKKTGIGAWTKRQIVTAITTGRRPDGRMLAPIMPWRDFARLTRSDADAIAAYLKTLRPVRHAVPGPFGPNAKISTAVMMVLPAAVYNKIAASPKEARGKE